jgi:hypothetical protein
MPLAFGYRVVRSHLQCFGTILLKLEQSFPHPGLKQAGSPQIRVRLADVAEELLEDVEEGLVIDELR